MIAATKESELVQRGDTRQNLVVKKSPDHTLGEGVASPIARFLFIRFLTLRLAVQLIAKILHIDV